MERKRFYLNQIITFNSSNFDKSFFDRKIKVKLIKKKTRWKSHQVAGCHF